jgi:uncharacterized protein GlcG (DUF336 family)
MFVGRKIVSKHASLRAARCRRPPEPVTVAVVNSAGSITAIAVVEGDAVAFSREPGVFQVKITMYDF